MTTHQYNQWLHSLPDDESGIALIDTTPAPTTPAVYRLCSEALALAVAGRLPYTAYVSRDYGQWRVSPRQPSGVYVCCL